MYTLLGYLSNYALHIFSEIDFLKTQDCCVSWRKSNVKMSLLWWILSKMVNRKKIRFSQKTYPILKRCLNYLFLKWDLFFFQCKNSIKILWYILYVKTSSLSLNNASKSKILPSVFSGKLTKKKTYVKSIFVFKFCIFRWLLHKEQHVWMKWC